MAPTIWQQNGAFSWHPTPGVIDRLVHYGFKWMAVLGYDELSPIEHTPNAPFWNLDFFEEHFAYATEQGLSLLLWANPREDMHHSAEGIKKLFQYYPFKGLIVDCEFEFKYSPVDGDASVTRFERSAKLVAELSDLKCPKAVSCLGDGSDIDYLAFYPDGYRFLPQAYSNEFQHLKAPLCVNRLRNPPLTVGWRYLCRFTNGSLPQTRIVKIIGQDSKGMIVQEGKNRWGLRQNCTVFNRNKYNPDGSYFNVGILEGFCPTSYIHPTIPTYIGMETGRRTDLVDLVSEVAMAGQQTKNTGVSIYLAETALDSELEIIGNVS